MRCGGRLLLQPERIFFEARLGQDLSGVRIHDDAEAAAAAGSVRARAFTVARDVVFASGQYAPGTQKGRRLIAIQCLNAGEVIVVPGKEEPPGEDIWSRLKRLAGAAGAAVRHFLDRLTCP